MDEEQKNEVQSAADAGAVEKINPPDYAYTYKLDNQEQLMKEAGIVGTYRELFMTLCRYVTTEHRKNAQVNVRNFCQFVHEKGNIPGMVVRENIQTHTNRLLLNLMDKDVDLIYIKETEDDGRPKEIVLKNKGEVIASEMYLRAVKLLKQANRNVLDDKSNFYDLESLSRDLHVDPDYIEKNFIIQVDNENLTEDGLYAYRKQEKILRIDIDDRVHILITPEDLKSLVNVLVEKIRSYYEDAANDMVRNQILRGFKEKNIDIKRIPEILRGENISDKNFLLFTQLFINIVKAYQDQSKDKMQVARFSLVNQYVAARFLSILSMSKRKEDRTRKLGTEKKEKDIERLVHALIEESSAGSQSQREFHPFTLSQIGQFKTWKEEGEVSTEKRESALFGELYDAATLKQMIDAINSANPHEIPNVLSFSAAGDAWFVHRFRFIRAFFTARDSENNRIINRVRNEWIKYPERIVSASKEDQLWNKVEQSYVSDFFLAFLQAARRVVAIEAPQETYVKALIDRLFPTANEITAMKLGEDSLNRNQDGEPIQPNKILKLFLETIFIEGTFEERPLRQILGLDYDEIYDYVYEHVGMGFFRGIIQWFHSILKIFSFKRGLAGLNDALEERGFKGKQAAGRILDGAKNFGRKIAEAGSQFMDESPAAPDASPSGPKGGIKKDDNRLRAPNKKKEEYEKLKKVAALSASAKDLREKIDYEHGRWNNKIGDIGTNLREDVDNLILTLSKRFAIEAYADSNADRLASDIVANNKALREIKNQQALKRYVYLKALLTRVEELSS